MFHPGNIAVLEPLLVADAGIEGITLNETDQ
jgi:hypothetical protein